MARRNASNNDNHNHNNNNNNNKNTITTDLQQQSYNVRIKCSGGTDLPLNEEYNVTVSDTDSVEQLKCQVKHAIGKAAQGRYMRLIYGGKLLAPDAAKVEGFKLKEGVVLHCVLAPTGVRSNGIQAAMARGDRPNLEIGSEEENSSSDDEETGNARRGFDRLRSSGLSRAEVATIRLYFAPQVEEYIRQTGVAQNNDPAVRPRMEEQWMSLQGPTSEFRANLNSNTNNLILTSFRNVQVGGTSNNRNGEGDRQFLVGFILGFLIGMISIVWLWSPSISQRQKLGILCGISFNKMMGVFVPDPKVDHETEAIEEK